MASINWQFAKFSLQVCWFFHFWGWKADLGHLKRVFHQVVTTFIPVIKQCVQCPLFTITTFRPDILYLNAEFQDSKANCCLLLENYRGVPKLSPDEMLLKEIVQLPKWLLQRWEIAWLNASVILISPCEFAAGPQTSASATASFRLVGRELDFYSINIDTGVSILCIQQECLKKQNLHPAYAAHQPSGPGPGDLHMVSTTAVLTGMQLSSCNLGMNDCTESLGFYVKQTKKQP